MNSFPQGNVDAAYIQAVVRKRALPGQYPFAVHTRSDGYVFLAFKVKRTVWVHAGCRWMTLTAYRSHAKKFYGRWRSKYQETKRLLDLIELQSKRWKR